MEDAKPSVTDPGTKPNASTEGNKDGGANSQVAPAKDEFLEVMNETMGRTFASREDALKSLTNLKGMVGDQAIADLRKQAEDGSHFKKVVEAYSKEHGIAFDAAKNELISDLNSMENVQDTKPTAPSGGNDDARYGELKTEVTTLKMQLQEKDLVAEHPASAKVMNELKSLAAHSGKGLKETYEGSGLKALAEAALAADKANEKKPSPDVTPSSRTSPDIEGNSELVKTVQEKGLESDKVNLVKKALGI